MSFKKIILLCLLVGSLICAGDACPFLQMMKNRAANGDTKAKADLKRLLNKGHPDDDTHKCAESTEAKKRDNVLIDGSWSERRMVDTPNYVAVGKRDYHAVTGPTSTPQSFCRRTAAAKNVTQEALINLAVVYVFTAGTASGVPLLRHFDGSGDGAGPSGVAVDFVGSSPEETAARGNLVANLVAFFGELLGCDDPRFPKYYGSRDMKFVHRNMKIYKEDFELFNNVFVQFLSEQGVASKDQTAIAAVLEGFRGEICTGCSICNKYSQLLSRSNVDLMTTIITDVFTREVNDTSPIKSFFDGSGDGTNAFGVAVDFTQPGAVAPLAGGLIAFFGEMLGCNDAGFPVYQGLRDQKEIHKNMPIQPSHFNYFNTAIDDSLAFFGVSVEDRAAVQNVLESFRGDVCTRCSVCDRYSDALGRSNLDLMTTVVTAVFGEEVKAGSPLIRHFDGSGDGTNQFGQALDFITPGVAQSALVSGLSAFFGEALGCTDSDFPPYTGERDQKELHKNMFITNTDFDYFNSAFRDGLASQNVTTADQDFIESFLNTFRPQIARTSFCDRYSDARGLSNVDLMTNVVAAVFEAEVNTSSPLIRHFDGSGDGTNQFGQAIDFITPGAAQDALVSGLVAFFGEALGCSDANFPSFLGEKNQKEVHKNMVILPGDFDFFVSAFNTTLAGFGVSKADLDFVVGFLETFRVDICTRCSICDRYSDTLGFSNVDLMNAVVDAVFAEETKAGSPILRHFDGSGDGTNQFGQALDFTVAGAAQDALVNGLVTFFGEALGCSDADFPAFQGERDQKEVHKNMVITQDDFEFFNTAFATALHGLDVTQEDIDTIVALLNTFKPQICTKCSICDTYSRALGVTNLALMQTVVGATVAAEVAPESPIRRHFDGSGDGTNQFGVARDFVSDGKEAEAGALVDGLVAFFGPALGCTDGTVPAFQGETNQTLVHQNMAITQSDFDYFNSALLGVLFDAGVSNPDIWTVNQLLQSFREPVCTQCAPKAESLCAKYAQAAGLTQQALVRKVVIETYLTAIGLGQMLEHFSGLGAGRNAWQEAVNFVAEPTEAGRLIENLVAYFGNVVLDCDHPDFPKYRANIDMTFIHRNMRISKVNFDTFNKIFVGVFASNGATEEDYKIAGAKLEQLRPAVCTGCSDTPTLCQKYATATGKSQEQLLTDLVVATFLKEIAPGNGLRKHFDGSGVGAGPSGEALDFINDAQAQQALVDGLVGFFGVALGCTDVTFPPYTGNPDMKDVHKNMVISDAQFDKFNELLLEALQEAGVTQADRDAVGALLDSFRADIVSPTICAKYASALPLTQLELLNAVVVQTFTAAIDPASGLRAHFDGSGVGAGPGGARDFIDDAANRQALVDSLSAYFGAALGCDDASFPAYMGETDMAVVHAGMTITATQFDTFNAALLSVLETNGVTNTDRAIVATLLESFRADICTACEPPVAQTLCEKYASALSVSQEQLLTDIVIATFTKEIDPANGLRKHFDGTSAGTSEDGVARDFINSLDDQNQLVVDLVAFFGNALGCTAPDFPAYTGNSDMKEVHKFMSITNDEFSKFNELLVEALDDAGVGGDDQAIVATLLDSFRADIVSPPFCVKYERITGLSQEDLLRAVVTDTFLAAIVPASGLLSFFDGSGDGKPPGGDARDFVNDLEDQGALVSSLSAFFGSALGCTDAFASTYAGETDMAVLHSEMPINAQHFETFNGALVSVLGANGVTAYDQNTIADVLESFRGAICNQCDVTETSTTQPPVTMPTFCEKYASALSVTQEALFTKVVTDTFLAAIDPASGLRAHFDGSGVGKGEDGVARDFINDVTLQGELVVKLVAFFGSALGCSESGFPAYTGNANMKEVHKNMNITQEQFNTFNTALVGVLADEGVDAADQATVSSYLSAFREDICTACTDGSMEMMDPDTDDEEEGFAMMWLIIVAAAAGVCVLLLCLLSGCFLRERGRRRSAQTRAESRDTQLDSLYGLVDAGKSNYASPDPSAAASARAYGSVDRSGNVDTVALSRPMPARPMMSANGNTDAESGPVGQYKPVPAEQVQATQMLVQDTVREVRSALRDGVPLVNQGDTQAGFETFRRATERAQKNMEVAGRVDPEMFGEVAKKFMQALEQAQTEQTNVGIYTLRTNFDNFLELSSATALQAAAARQENQGLPGYDFSVRTEWLNEDDNV